MKIAVLGGGNGSFAAAGDFALAGHEVRLWRRDEEQEVWHGEITKVTENEIDFSYEVKFTSYCTIGIRVRPRCAQSLVVRD